MAVGDLSSAQRTYRDVVVRGTGLHRDVVTAWIGAESGWDMTKPGHNYLNIGPGRTYPSPKHAANAVVKLISSSGHYGGIRDAIRSGDPARQVKAITVSPWDAGRYGGDGSRLINVYNQIAGGSAQTTTVAADEDDPLAPEIPGPLEIDPETGEWRPKDRTSGDTWQERLGRQLADAVGRALISTVFTLAALVLIVVGLLQLLDVDPRDLMPGRD